MCEASPSPAPLPRSFPPPRIPFLAWFTAPLAPYSHPHPERQQLHREAPNPQAVLTTWHTTFLPKVTSEHNCPLCPSPWTSAHGRGSPPPLGSMGVGGLYLGRHQVPHCLWTLVSPHPLAAPTLPIWLESRTSPRAHLAGPHLRPGLRRQGADSQPSLCSSSPGPRGRACSEQAAPAFLCAPFPHLPHGRAGASSEGTQLAGCPVQQGRRGRREASRATHDFSAPAADLANL